ncbi:MAG: hypothetical protein L0271_08275 [Gemmatimonadetes bacterium]|nr:hypothetical protein [Gemmatimonadota bacterium]
MRVHRRRVRGRMIAGPGGRIALAVMLLAPAGRAVAQLPPAARWQTLEAEHVRVTYMPGLEALARRAAVTAETTWALLEESITRAPPGKVDIVLADNVDFSNGFASVFPSNRITVYARPPVDDEALSYSGSWIDLVVSHELAHIFHLDRSGRVGSALRTVFGRLPLLWPPFPAVATPGWSIEGLAVLVESAYTGFGRLHGSFHEMVVRTAVLEDRFDRMDRLNESSPIWPGGQRVYIYGSLFLEWLAEVHGDEVNGELVDRTASAFLPPFLFFDQVAKRTFGESFDDAFAAWRADLQAKYTRLADSLRATGLTTSRRITSHGRWAVYPRWSPDGRRIAYAAEDGASVTATRIIDAADGQVLESHRSNGLGVQAWHPDGRSLVRSQFEYDGPYHILRDLDVVGENARRLTHQMRLQDPDFARDGERVIAVENGGGTNRLVMASLASGDVTPVTTPDPAVQWAFPRWSPDGARIAVSRARDGGEYDIVVLDAGGREVAQLTADAAIDAAPAWSPDGRWIVFHSDRSGIPNLYAADVSNPRAPVLRQVTNVLGGALYPDVSSDGRWITFAGYHADGFSIERMPFDPSAWRDPSPVVLHAHAPERADAAGSATLVQLGQPRGYSPMRSLTPRFWIPVGQDEGDAGLFGGIQTEGRDLVGRHNYAAWLMLDADGSGRWQGALGWSLARLGNPVIGLAASREWFDLGNVLVQDSMLPLDTIRVALQRQDEWSAFLTFLRRRWRSSASLTVGVEREVLRRVVLGLPRRRFVDDADRLWNLIGRVTWANTRNPSYAVSREDGIVLSVEAQHTIESNATPEFPRGYNEFEWFTAAYKSLPLGSFAHHVLAVRTSGRVRTGDGARLTSIGGGSGGRADVLGVNIGGGTRFLPVRGFDAGILAGTRAWTATLEYRAPLALLGRRPALSPVFFDRISAAGFADLGDAECTGLALQRFPNTCGRRNSVSTPLIGAGAELVLDIGFAGIFPARVRLGVAAPVRGPDGSTRLYAHLGANF